MPATPHRILVAEAEHAARSALEELLGDEGYLVTSTSNGADALAALDAIGADLLLMDLVMALGDGESLLASVRSRYPEMPTILMTGLPPDEPRVTNVIQDPAIEAIHKPVDLEALFEAVEAALSRTLLVADVGPEQPGKREPASLAEARSVR